MRLRPWFLLLIPTALLPLIALSFLASRLPFQALAQHLHPSAPKEEPPIDPRAFQHAALQAANQARARIAAPAPALDPHPVATEALQTLVTSHLATPDILFSKLQESRPQLYQIGSRLITSSSQEGLLHALIEWPELTKSSYTHLATTVFRQTGRPETLCLATLLQELPPLRLPSPRRATFTAYDTCPLCHTGQGLTLQPQSQSTLFIRCPHCHKTYNLLAADSSGNWRRANQFLEGIDRFHVEPGLTPEQTVLSVWRQVDERCRYQYDPERVGGEDSWNLPRQTYALGWGDCEDTSMLLADALISNGIDARVALGSQKGQGHAWCVVRLGERQFILESTAEGVGLLRWLPPMDDLAIEYQPECQFDRENVYFNRYHQWTANYWSEATWQQVHFPAETAPTIASTGS